MKLSKASKSSSNSESCSRLTGTSLRLASMSDHATRLSHTITSAWRAGSVILPMIAAALLIFALPKVGLAQASNTIVYDGNTTFCGDGCCQEFTITINGPTDTVDIIMGDWGGGGSNCFDHTCWSGQGLPTETFEEGWSGSNDFRIVASHTDVMWLGPFPVTLHVYICGTYDCLQQYDRWDWSTNSGASYTSGIPYPLYETNCQVIPPCTSGCSYITVSPYGTGTYVPSCGTEICFYNQTGSTLSSFMLNFNPPLDPGNPCGMGTAVPCNSFTPNDPIVDPSYFRETNYDPLTGDATFTGFTAGVDNCSSVCVYVPRCVADDDPGAYETVSLVSPVNPGTCSSDITSIIVDMKKLDGTLSTPAADSGGQNYPNPLDASTGFNTTIPFATSAGGTAEINVVNEKGVKILTDDEEILGPGQHFFYFSGKDLPSGTYYYTIEFPQGVVIASKTMLVVK